MLHKELILVACCFLWPFAVWRKNEPWSTWLGLQLFLSVIVEYRAMFLGAQFQHNHVIYNAYMVLEFILMNGMLRNSRTGPRGPRWAEVTGVLVYLAVLIWSIWSGWSKPDLWTNALIVGGSIIGLHAAFVLFHLANDGQRRLLTVPVFWVVLAVMVYFFTFIVIFGLYNYLIDRSEHLAGRVYAINDILFLLRYGLTLVGLSMMIGSSSQENT